MRTSFKDGERRHVTQNKQKRTDLLMRTLGKCSMIRRGETGVRNFKIKRMRTKFKVSDLQTMLGMPILTIFANQNRHT